MSYPVLFNIPITLIEQDIKNNPDIANKLSFEKSKRICLFIKNSPNMKEKKRQISKTVNKYTYKKIYN